MMSQQKNKILFFQKNNECPFLTFGEVALEFFINIAINHNVLVNVESSSKEHNSYSGSNPDEVVLVQAARR